MVLDLNCVIPQVSVISPNREDNGVNHFLVLIITDVQGCFPGRQNASERLDYLFTARKLDGIQLDLLANAFDGDSMLNEQCDVQGPTEYLLHQSRYCDFLLDPNGRSNYVAALDLSSMMHYDDEADGFV